MRSSSPVWFTWEQNAVPRDLDTAAVSAKVIRNPDDPFSAWDEYGRPILPMTLGDDCPSSEGNAAPGGVDVRTGRMTASVLAPQLHWQTVSASAHALTWLSYRGRRVPIDINIAPVVEAMWQAGFISLCSCEGRDTAEETGYTMFSEETGKRFMEWAQAREQHLPAALMRRFEVLLQDDEWHRYMADRYPLLDPVERDSNGRLFTLCWRFHRQDLLDHRDLLVKLLRAGPQRRTDQR